MPSDRDEVRDRAARERALRRWTPRQVHDPFSSCWRCGMPLLASERPRGSCASCAAQENTDEGVNLSTNGATCNPQVARCSRPARPREARDL